MAVRHTVVVFPNLAERNRARSLLQSAGHEVEVLQVPAGLSGVRVAALHFPQEQANTLLHLLARQSVLITGTAHLDSSQIPSAAPERELPEERDLLIPHVDLIEVLPCLADYRKIRARALLSNDVRPVMPYLNALLASGTFNAASETFTFNQGDVRIALYPTRVEMAKADDILDALQHLARLREWLNETWAKRDSITPSYERRVSLHALQIYPYLPAGHHNCRRCGEWTCLAFAIKVIHEMDGRTVGDCLPLRQDPNYEEQRSVLYGLLRAAGYPVPTD